MEPPQTRPKDEKQTRTPRNPEEVKTEHQKSQKKNSKQSRTPPPSPENHHTRRCVTVQSVHEHLRTPLSKPLNERRRETEKNSKQMKTRPRRRRETTVHGAASPSSVHEHRRTPLSESRGEKRRNNRSRGNCVLSVREDVRPRNRTGKLEIWNLPRDDIRANKLLMKASQFDSMVLLRQGMQQFRNYYNSEAHMLRSRFARGTISETYKNSFLKPKAKSEIKLLTAKKHSEAEKRRRMRINGQYAALRILLPDLIKMDKASVLAETIRQLKELKVNVSELEAVSGGTSGEITVFPSGADKLNVEHCNDEQGLVKATLSCEDRPGLMSAITRALRSVKAKVVKAEMVTVGGRTRNVLWVQGLGNGNEGMGVLKRTLKVVMHRPNFKMQHLTR
ncbi:transcription factor bHLH131 [Senna tora]|uniref:Transcription factor bHLH131 n=1 Tax=Senna tora TaxID=362788 RepID=A0A834T4G2_9FABA|nr:transcription factor bHLH131 [Senna tora]